MKTPHVTLLVASFAAFALGQPAAALPKTADSVGALDPTTHAPGPVAPEVDASCDGDVEYCPSPDQLRVDASFSPLPIDSYLAGARGALAPTEEENCDPSSGCEWRDGNGVRHFAWGDSDEDLRIVVKTVEAKEFAGRPIEALGIGTARKQADVVANVRRFLPGVEIVCDPARVSGNVGPVECGATLNPGWIQIGFDLDGNLLRVRFDGYQFI